MNNGYLPLVDGALVDHCGFADRGARYMIHCHNLVHEDHAMMLQMQMQMQMRMGLRADEADPNDPILAAPPVWDPIQDWPPA